MCLIFAIIFWCVRYMTSPGCLIEMFLPIASRLFTVRFFYGFPLVAPNLPFSVLIGSSFLL